MLFLSSALASLVASFLVSTGAHGFQASPDQHRYKQAIEKATGDHLTSNEFKIDHDTRFSPYIPFMASAATSFVVRPLSESVMTKNSFPPTKKVVPRKIFGMDEEPSEYWFHNKIHTFGNTNIFGGLHAAVAPFATRLIDDKAYDGVNARTTIAKCLRATVNKTNAYVLDLCCGVGMSTRALSTAFHDAEFICGIDTSPEMISMAHTITKHNALFDALESLGMGKDFKASFTKLALEIKNAVTGKTLNPKVKYARGNAERVKAPKSKFDLVTLFYAFHEIPKSARSRIIREARRLLKSGGTLAIVDICPVEYVPTGMMLAGEPYVLEYQQNICKQIEKFQGFHDLQKTAVIPGHVTMWTLTRNHNHI